MKNTNTADDAPLPERSSNQRGRRKRDTIRYAVLSFGVTLLTVPILHVLAPRAMEAERREAARLVVTTRADLVAGLPCPSRDDFEIECRGRQVRVVSRGPFWLFGLGGIDVGDGPRVRMAGVDQEMHTADDVVVGPERVTEYLSTSELLLLTQRRNRERSR